MTHNRETMVRANLWHISTNGSKRNHKTNAGGHYAPSLVQTSAQLGVTPCRYSLAPASVVRQGGRAIRCRLLLPQQWWRWCYLLRLKGPVWAGCTVGRTTGRWKLCLRMGRTVTEPRVGTGREVGIAVRGTRIVAEVRHGATVQPRPASTRVHRA